MKRVLSLFFLLTASLSFGQTEFIAYPATGKGVSSTFVTDYHCLGINPANLGWQAYDKRITTGTQEFGLSMYSASLAKQDLRDNLWGVIRSGSLEDLSDQEKLDAAQGFADDFAFNFDYNYFGFSFQNEKLGGIAFSMRSRASWASGLSEDMSKLLFQGRRSDVFDSLITFNGVDTTVIANDPNLDTATLSNVISGKANVPFSLSNLMGDTYLRLSLNREYHLGYGRKILAIDSSFILYGGVGFKYIEGLAIMDLGTNSSGQLEMFSAFSQSFDLDYDPAAVAANPSAVAGDPNNFWRKKVGQGFGLDFGVNMTFFKNFHVAASVTNIGSMTYTGNVYTATDTLIVDYNAQGIKDMNIANSVGELVEVDGLLNIQGEQERKVALPGTFRIGASMELGKAVHVGGELISPFNNIPGSINGFAWGLGSDFKLAQGKIILMTGVTGGGGYDVRVPVGINFVLGGGAYEAGIASRDAVTFFAKNTPTISAAFGFARVRF